MAAQQWKQHKMLTGELVFPLHLSIQVQTGLITEPPYAESVEIVCLLTGLLLRRLCTFSGRMLALAPVSSLNVIFPPSVETVESHLIYHGPVWH